MTNVPSTSLGDGIADRLDHATPAAHRRAGPRLAVPGDAGMASVTSPMAPIEPPLARSLGAAHVGLGGPAQLPETMRRAAAQHHERQTDCRIRPAPTNERIIDDQGADPERDQDERCPARSSRPRRSAHRRADQPEPLPPFLRARPRMHHRPADETSGGRLSAPESSRCLGEYERHRTRLGFPLGVRASRLVGWRVECLSRCSILTVHAHPDDESSAREPPTIAQATHSARCADRLSSAAPAAKPATS